MNASGTVSGRQGRLLFIFNTIACCFIQVRSYQGGQTYVWRYFIMSIVCHRFKRCGFCTVLPLFGAQRVVKFVITFPDFRTLFGNLLTESQCLIPVHWLTGRNKQSQFRQNYKTQHTQKCIRRNICAYWAVDVKPNCSICREFTENCK